MVRASICLEMIYDDKAFVDRIDRVADLGFGTVEFWTWPDKDLDAIETLVDERELSLAAMAANQEQARPEALQRPLTDPTEQTSVVEDIEESIEVAERFNCPNLIVLVGPSQGHDDATMFESIVAVLREVAPVAERAGVSLLIEPLNTAVDHEGYFLKESSLAYEVVCAVDSPAVGVLFDIYHQQISEGNIIANVTNHVDEIGHIHVADVPGRHEPGTGELNYANIFSALDSVGYDGYVGFEFEPETDTDTALQTIRELVK